MTKDEALKLALEALESSRVFVTTREKIKHPEGTEWYDQAITAIKEALAQEQDGTYVYASNLAKTIWQKHYMKESPKFALLDTTEGVLTQIDNMTCGLVREKPAQPEQEPVAYGTWDTMLGKGHRMMMVRLDKGQDGCTVPLYITPPQRTWVGLTDEERQDIALEVPIDAVFITEAKLKELNK
jgi:hypothetical protein